MANADRIPFRENELLRAIPAERLEEARVTPEVLIPGPGDPIFEEGEPGNHCYLVESGLVELSKATDGGVQEVIARVGPGGFFGELALYDDAPRSARATAAERSVLAVIDRATFHRLRKAAPLEVTSVLADISIERVRQLNTRIARESRTRRTGADMETYSHNMRVPIATLIDAIGLLSEAVAGGAGSEEVLKWVAMVDRSARKALANADRHIAELRGERVAERTNVGTRELVDEVREQTTAFVGGEGVHFIAGVEFEGAVNVERDQFVAALANLVRNAAESLGSAGGEVSLSVTEENRWVEFSVIDNGCGIPDEIKEKIFERKFTHGKEQGTGLGLDHVKVVAERHGGAVTVESVVGTGTTFRLRIPL